MYAIRSYYAFEVYRKTYRSSFSSERVAELLILHPDMPRSLLFCLKGVLKNLELLANSQSRETQRLAGQLHSEIRYARIDDILRLGLHEYLSNFMDRIYDLGNRISCDFLVSQQEIA